MDGETYDWTTLGVIRTTVRAVGTPTDINMSIIFLMTAKNSKIAQPT